MQSQEFYRSVEELFLVLEEKLEAADIDYESAERLMTIYLPQGSQMIISCQAAMQEIWLASPRGAYHFAQQAEGWYTNKGEAFLQIFIQHLT